MLLEISALFEAKFQGITRLYGFKYLRKHLQAFDMAQ